MDKEALEGLERQHEKDLLALEQEIEGWRAANRILKAHLKQAEKALEKAIVQMTNDHNELAMEFGYAEKINDSEAMRESQQALQAIRGKDE